ncbi:MAG TPA: C10 family peptidase, partial [Bacteroidales bacterium]|nr:C10 family peptidase [Bacteroidales bacterium]
SLLGLVLLAEAARVPVATARQVALSVITQRAPAETRGLLSISSQSTRYHEGAEVYHVFRLEPAGFVVVSGEDQAFPLLAYSFASDFPEGSMPAHITEWMDGYTEEIALLRDNDAEARPEVTQAWQDYLQGVQGQGEDEVRGVQPLLLCTWNQGTYYNGLCPDDPDGPGGKVYAGCVATAMGQVMYYYRHPQTGTGSSSYNHPDYGWLSANYGTTTYAWGAMLNSINSPNHAIAELLLHCGIAVEMGYSPTGSGAYSSDAAAALRNNFGYSSSTQLVHKTNYTDQAWKELLKGQLDAGKPMYYHGYGSGGHAFNVDGYQGDDHFHFNWGWGGSYNGYYFLTDLNPGGSNFSNGQGAIINISPAGTYPDFCGGSHLLTAPAGTFEDGSGPVADYQANASCSWLIAPQQDPGDSISSITLMFDRFSTQDNSDHVAVYAGGTPSATLVGKYSGSNLPAKVSVEGNMMLVVFESDADTQSSGFYASYSSTVPDYCTKSPALFTDSTGILSDGSGQKNYNNRSICQWSIAPEGAEAVVLAFTSFDTEPQSDFLEVYAYEPSTGNGTLLGRYSGNTLPPVLSSNTGAFYLIFFSNAEVTRGGWEAHYSASAVGLDEPAIAQARLYPNPAQDVLYIEWVSKDPGQVQLGLFDLTGRLMLSVEAPLADQRARLDLSGLAAGQYVLQMISAGGVRMEKVVVR